MLREAKCPELFLPYRHIVLCDLRGTDTVYVYTTPQIPCFMRFRRRGLDSLWPNACHQAFQYPTSKVAPTMTSACLKQGTWNSGKPNGRLTALWLR